MFLMGPFAEFSVDLPLMEMDFLLWPPCPDPAYLCVFMGVPLGTLHALLEVRNPGTLPQWFQVCTAL